MSQGEGPGKQLRRDKKKLGWAGEKRNSEKSRAGQRTGAPGLDLFPVPLVFKESFQKSDLEVDLNRINKLT